MRFNSKFNLGDLVYPVQECMKDHTETCPDCKGKGRVTIQESGKKVMCEECWGRGINTTSLPMGFYLIPRSISKIGKIECSAYSKEHRSQRKALEVTYMLEATGVGSGSIWSEERLFSTQKEAEEFCNDKNKTGGK